jgi:hypothetical protein
VDDAQLIAVVETGDLEQHDDERDARQSRQRRLGVTGQQQREDQRQRRPQHVGGGEEPALERLALEQRRQLVGALDGPQRPDGHRDRSVDRAQARVLQHRHIGVLVDRQPCGELRRRHCPSWIPTIWAHLRAGPGVRSTPCWAQVFLGKWTIVRISTPERPSTGPGATRP